jgi:hypothetical protein
MFRKLNLLLTSGEGKDMSNILGLSVNGFRLVCSKGPSRAGAFLPSPEVRNISSFRNDVFSSKVAISMPDEVDF